jgi:hypothetical protein
VTGVKTRRWGSRHVVGGRGRLRHVVGPRDMQLAVKTCSWRSRHVVGGQDM